MRSVDMLFKCSECALAVAFLVLAVAFLICHSRRESASRLCSGHDKRCARATISARTFYVMRTKTGESRFPPGMTNKKGKNNEIVFIPAPAPLPPAPPPAQRPPTHDRHAAAVRRRSNSPQSLPQRYGSETHLHARHSL